MCGSHNYSDWWLQGRGATSLQPLLINGHTPTIIRHSPKINGHNDIQNGIQNDIHFVALVRHDILNIHFVEHLKNRLMPYTYILSNKFDMGCYDERSGDAC